MQGIAETPSPIEDEPQTAFRGEPLTCSLQEAAKLIGHSYDWVLGQSKIVNPKDRIPGFKTGKLGYRVIIAELPGWLNRKAGLS